MKHHVIKACGGVEVYTHAFSTSVLDGGERFDVPVALYPLSHRVQILDRNPENVAVSYW